MVNKQDERLSRISTAWTMVVRAHGVAADAACRTGQPYYAVLRCRSDHPELRSPQMAERLSSQLGKPLTAAATRQLLHRARERFGDLLLDEVIHSLANPTAEQVEQELID